ncbi:DNA (cytosine-5-)-methyltransferase [Paenibacillus beijingensis]|uniref:Cytosine-specific methyltransferase n=1 Tax=Paenibacillus beijingensis TaxID=1126833 RepID=A0A0D5NGB1_9BACL|nr:DNA (cytosine-5-)-methyltransferase [Paenibacillus beijingensis]AJY74296.1 DNA methyltransferase [Paenibacillus beijingensis]
MKFIDLFAGLGGFNLALSWAGHECVFASEIDEGLRKLYLKNHGIMPRGDIKAIKAKDVPEHDILCGGFPCQPFSKAGEQNGFKDEKSGDLFYHIVKILRLRRPTYIMLENVANFERHDEGRTWRIAKKILIELGYEVDIRKLSPHWFGIPQIRERVFIVGSRKGLSHFKWPEKLTVEHDISIKSVLDKLPTDARQLPEHVNKCIAAWQQFLNIYPEERNLPSFPIWSMEFGATYPYEEETPWKMGSEKLRGYLGSHGRSLENLTKEELFLTLPSYARTKEDRFPDWKIRFIKQNRQLYEDNKEWIDEWLPSILDLPSSFQKFEWNCKGAERNLTNLVLQCRASGLRAKRPTTSPSLVAMTATQVPIITWENRYMTPRECARLQSMDSLKCLPEGLTSAYKALGNALNVEVVHRIIQSLIMEESINNQELNFRQEMQIV